MKNYYLLASVILWMASLQPVQGRQIDINVTIKGAIPVTEVSLYGYTPTGERPMQKATSGADDKTFRFSLPMTTKPGVYQIKTEPTTRNVDVIVNGRDTDVSLSIVTGIYDQTNPVSFTVSAENQAYNQYQFESQQALSQLTQLRIIQRQTRSAAVREKIGGVIDVAFKDCEAQRNAFIQRNANTLAAKLVRNNPHRADYFNMVDLPVSETVQNNYWKGIDTASDELMNSGLYPELLYNYMMFYSLKARPDGYRSLDDYWRKAADTLMGCFGGTDRSSGYITSYLEMFFLQQGRNELARYVHENYSSSELCTDELSNSSSGDALAHFIEGLKFTAPGQPAFDIPITDPSGRVLHLKDLPGDRLLIVFWNTSCSHCTEQMPLVEEYLEASAHKPTVMAVCISADEKAYAEMIQRYPEMIHLRDAKGYSGELADKYYITGTPTFFLLDKDRNFHPTF
jgi:thiol-disulfide isomerase/thioredoxin